jgi:hypothetical protein
MTLGNTGGACVSVCVCVYVCVCKTYAGNPLVLGEIGAAEGSVEALDLDQEKLHHERAQDNDHKEGVLEHAIENVELVVDLYKHK